MTNDLVELREGRLKLHLHPGQMYAWQSDRRFILVLAGTQGGKTSFGPHWLYREIARCGPGDYMVVTPTYPLLELKLLPTFRQVFEQWLALGRYVGSPSKVFVFSEDGARRTFGAGFNPAQAPPTRVLFGYAMDPDSLESATAKAAWLDEPGQRRFKEGSWEAILRRLSLARGRVLLTTTPYSNRGWLRRRVYDRWAAGDSEYDVVQFESVQNPMFSAEEWERAKRELPRWKFDLFYRGKFTRPAGLIYDSFEEDRHTCPRFPIPEHWPRFLGLDFGGVNTAGVFFAEEPGTGRLFAYREYHEGGRTAAQHATALLEGEPGIPYCVGGSRSEQQWRDEFKAGGLPVRQPDIADVEVGIDRVWGAHNQDQIIVFDDLEGYLDEKASYSRELDDTGEPTEFIEDKSDYHLMDAERYIIGWLRKTAKPMHSGQVDWYAPGRMAEEVPSNRSDDEIEQLLKTYESAIK